MSFAELKSFHMVTRLGSITQAAKKLGLSQPTVTTQIRNLVDALRPPSMWKHYLNPPIPLSAAFAQLP
jgi:hypothetical protein